MRPFVVTFLLALLSTRATADKKIVDMTPGFKRELTACETQANGLTLVIAKTRAVVAQEPPDKPELAADLERLVKGHEVVTGYCGDVRAMVELLEANARVAYKRVERAIDTQDNTVRKARKAGKQITAELEPITRKLIPRINARIVAKQPERTQTGTFPSGRVLALPSSLGVWKLGGNAVSDVADHAVTGLTASITTRPFTNGTCAQQHEAFVAKAGDAQITELDVAPHVGWRYVRRDRTPHALTLICAASGFVAIADVTPATAKADAVTQVMLAMLAAR